AEIPSADRQPAGCQVNVKTAATSDEMVSLMAKGGYDLVTFFFIDKGTQRGATHDIFIALENELNKQLAKDKKLKQRHLPVLQFT
ncbi:hypothetical protein FK521_29135, partial [Klebsiella pneumoniae]|nr:hypothetical protein [Klebsiella pneumoniae]